MYSPKTALQSGLKGRGILCSSNSLIEIVVAVNWKVGNYNNESWCIIYLIIITSMIKIVVKMVVMLINKYNNK